MNTPPNHNQHLGKQGEDLAAAYLINKGYQILSRNLRIGRAEIDILAGAEDWLVFVEVKTRTTSYFGFPEEFVTPHKEKMLFEASEIYCLDHNIDSSVRFDIVSVILNKNQQEIHHFEDAFWSTG